MNASSSWHRICWNKSRLSLVILTRMSQYCEALKLFKFIISFTVPEISTQWKLKVLKFSKVFLICLKLRWFDFFAIAFKKGSLTPLGYCWIFLLWNAQNFIWLFDRVSPYLTRGMISFFYSVTCKERRYSLPGMFLLSVNLLWLRLSKYSFFAFFTSKKKGFFECYKFFNFLDIYILKSYFIVFFDSW